MFLGKQTDRRHNRYLSPVEVWALSFGCIVGWGAFIMPGTTFLPMAGPAGTAIGMAVGAAVMLVIAVNYGYMMSRRADSGGTFTYTRVSFGDDHGFLSAWFMILAYVSILWANMTAVALVARNIFGTALMQGYLYTLAGYKIYIGEIIAELAVLAVFGTICIVSRKTAAVIQTVCAFLLIGGIIVSFCLTAASGENGASFLEPAFVPGVNELSQVMGVVALAPWAFVGFESISNSGKEFRFKAKKTTPIMIIAIITGFAAYTLLAFTAATVQPEGYSDWAGYIADLGSHEGSIAGIPVFYALEKSFGQTGVVILGTALISAILTGIIGSTIASSRLLCSMSKQHILPRWFGEMNSSRTPKNAILFIMAISAVIPFLGRTAIGWVVDVITVGTTIAYGYTSAAAFKSARKKGNRKIMVTGIAGIVISAVIGLLLLVPDLLADNTLSAESYLLLAFWGILGIIFFRIVFSRDSKRRFGGSTVVWIALLFLIFFTSLMWVRQATNARTREVVTQISGFYTEEMHRHGIESDTAQREHEQEYLEEQMDSVRKTQTFNSIVQMLLIMLSLVVIFNIYNALNRREKAMEKQKIKAEETSRAKSAFLSNMSHDIRTPMNAIVGYINLAKSEDLSLEEVRGYLSKIETSSEHLLALINDILEMSRIESGKMELSENRTDLCRLLDDVRDMFATQMSEKHITYKVFHSDLTAPVVMCDTNRLNRVMLNLISNAYKFTPEGGNVTVSLRQTDGGSEDYGSYEIRVRDSGIGMTGEFASKVFEAFERERTSTVSGIQGTGLGMAITKNIIDLMNGTITVDTAPGKGTEFTVSLKFRICGPDESAALPETHTEKAVQEDLTDLRDVRVLLADDVEINREIAAKILQRLGLTVDTAVNGQEVLDKITASEPGYYDIVLMDIQMPVMDGYEAARRIRALGNKELASIPVVAMTANAFSEDVQKAAEAGMNGHIAKPIDITVMEKTITGVLKEHNSR